MPTVRINAEDLSPTRATVGPGGMVVLTNASTTMARIEFRLPAGAGIECSSDGGTPVKARKFVVDDGAALLCDTPPGRYDYTVYRNARTATGQRKLATKGRIDVR